MLPHLPTNPGIPAILNCTVPNTRWTHTEAPPPIYYNNTTNNERNFIDSHADQHHTEIVTPLPCTANSADAGPTSTNTHKERESQQAVDSIVTIEQTDSGGNDVRRGGSRAGRRRQQRTDAAQMDSHSADNSAETDIADANCGRPERDEADGKDCDGVGDAVMTTVPSYPTELLCKHNMQTTDLHK